MKCSAVLSLFMALASVAIAVPLEGQGGASVNFLDIVKRGSSSGGCTSDDDCAGACTEFNTSYAEHCLPDGMCLCNMDSDDACKRACVEGPGGFDGGHQSGDGCLCTKKGKKGKGNDD
ncbi:hypothetical protein IFR05_009440 [Cadophora sp. M221]|nr:hypothetical protein IFR05_009440 [Cadophora sp. M221]